MATIARIYFAGAVQTQFASIRLAKLIPSDETHSALSIILICVTTQRFHHNIIFAPSHTSRLTAHENIYSCLSATDFSIQPTWQTLLEQPSTRKLQKTQNNKRYSISSRVHTIRIQPDLYSSLPDIFSVPLWISSTASFSHFVITGLCTFESQISVRKHPCKVMNQLKRYRLLAFSSQSAAAVWLALDANVSWEQMNLQRYSF